MSKGKTLENKGKFVRAAKWFEQQGLYEDAARCWRKVPHHPSVIRCYLKDNVRRSDEESRTWFFLYSFKYAVDHLSKEEAQAIIIDHWATFADNLQKSRGEGLSLHCEDEGEYADQLVDIIKAFEGHSFLDDLVRTLACGFFVLAKKRSDTSPIDFAKLIRERCGLPIAAAQVCTLALEKKAPSRNCWDEWTPEEAVWLEELYSIYMDVGKPEEAVNVYMSRNRYAEAASVLEDVGRLEEALTLLREAGPANYRVRGWRQPWGGHHPPDMERRRCWQERISQIEGKIEVRKGLGAGGEPRKDKPTEQASADELERMFALGEITREELERMKKGTARVDTASRQSTSPLDDSPTNSASYSTSTACNEYPLQDWGRESPKRSLASAWNWLNRDRPQLGFWCLWLFSCCVTSMALFFLVPEIPDVLRWRPLWRGLAVILVFTIFTLPFVFDFILGVLVIARWLLQRLGGKD